MNDDAIISPDTRRDQRIPPRQVLTHKWPVLHVGSVPGFDPKTWDFTIFPVPFVNAVIGAFVAAFCFCAAPLFGARALLFSLGGLAAEAT